MNYSSSIDLDQPQRIDALAFRATLGLYASSVVVITGRDKEGPIGFTCQTFYSASLEPPLVAFSVMNTSTSYPRIRATKRFAVNLLSVRQENISSQFARRGTDKWAGVSWRKSALGNPIIDDTLMWVDCEIQSSHQTGDHETVVGRVIDLSPTDWNSGTPLIFFSGAYRHLR